ncbi:MAG: M43 family zinc metalloprotease [Bacteroidota bacterium]|nr:M43 family zinc metalloprotease [Bacteroidota bacterium]
MKKHILSFFILLFAFSISFGQGQEVCGSYQGYLDDDKKKYPEFYNNLHEKELKLQKEYTKALESISTANTSSLYERKSTKNSIQAKSDVITGSCISPINPITDGITPNQATLHWESSSTPSYGYRVVYRKIGEWYGSYPWMTDTIKFKKDGQGNLVEEDSLVITRLTPDHTYEWQVRSMCDSIWEWVIFTDSMAIEWQDPINGYITYYSEDTSGAFVLTGSYQIVVDTLSSDTSIVTIMDTIGLTNLADFISTDPFLSTLKNPPGTTFLGIDESAWTSIRSFKTDKRTIPVVVHIIHDLGQENVSDEEVYMAIETLNKNINGQGYNFEARTPPVFAALRGVAGVEFKLAQKDPEGNPTTGILRVQSPLTFEPVPGNSVKTLSYWNSYEYYNIWVLRKFAPQDDGNTLLGYAQFPGQNMLTDGVVLIYSEFNDPTSATLTHETGHWLGLCHPWDCGSGTCGDDNIFDTPPARQANFGVSFNDFPYHVGLQNQGCIADSMNWAGEMFMNYMDYTPDQYTTMFSKDQVSKMHEILDGADANINIGYREYLWSPKNIVSAGIENSSGVQSASADILTWCKRNVDFKERRGDFSICEGEENWLESNKSIFGNTIDSCSWTLGGNTTISGGSLDDPGFLLFEYDSVGSYDVSIFIRYNEELTRESNNLRGFFPDSVDGVYLNIDDSIISLMESDIITQGSLSNSYLTNLFDSLASLGLIDALDSSIIPTSISMNIDQNIAQSHSAFTTETFSTIGATPTDTFSIDNLGIYWGINGMTYHRGLVNDTNYIAYYNGVCTSYKEEKDFIIVYPGTVGDTLESKIYTFDDAANFSKHGDPNTTNSIKDWIGYSNNDMDSLELYWSITGEGGTTIDHNSKTWEWVTWTSSDISQSSLMMNGYNNISLGTDELISKSYNLSALDTPAIRFNWAGAHFDEFPVNELNIYYSDNCGEDWKNVKDLSNLNPNPFEISPADLASSGYIPNTFFPSVDDWEEILIVDTIGLNSLKKDNIRFKFEYITNSSYTNRFYIDNIEIGEKADLLAVNQNQDKMSARLSTYPNPYDPDFGLNVRLDNLKDQKVKVQLINILGKEIGLLYSGTVLSDSYVIDKINLNEFPRGIYFITIITDSKTILTDKLILNK